MTITKTMTRLGVTIFIILFNLFISIFVFILTGIMIFSQVLFIIFAVFLPISFLLSMIPTFNHLMKKDHYALVQCHYDASRNHVSVDLGFLTFFDGL